MVVGSTTTLQRPQVQEGFTHFLFVDADIAFNAAHVKKLLELDLDIVSGAYSWHHNKKHYVGGDYALFDGMRGHNVPVENTALSEVRWVGAGFLLVKREVFEKLDAPWFRHEWCHYDDKGTIHKIQTGEDIGFCLNAERQGYKIFMDCDCVVVHLERDAPQVEFPQAAPRARIVDDQGNEVSPVDIYSKAIFDINKAVHMISGLQEHLNTLAQAAIGPQ
jgi:hypothetical protein